MIAELDAAVKTVCPILGVSVGDRADRRTWRADFAPEATTPQKSSAQTVIDTFDPNAVANLEAECKALLDGDKLIKAVAIWTAQKLGIPLPTARNEIAVIYRNL